MDPGRARGRAAGRGRGALMETEAGLFAREPSAAIAETEPAQRGRGGFYRPGETFCTIPPGVTVTTGDNQGNLKIVTNYFKLVVPKEQVVYAYHVDFEPQVESVKVRRGLIYENRQVFDRAYVFDGGSEIKSLCKLNSDPCTITGTRRDGASVTITIKFTTSVSWGHPEMLRLYNTQMRRNLEYLGFIQVGRDYYTPDLKKIMREHKIEVWPGILTAIAEHDGGILMVNDMINKIIRQEKALDVLNRIRSSDRNRTQELCNHELSGSIVMTQYNNKTYRVEEVILDKTPANYTFERRGETVNLRDYYNEQYDLRVSDDRQPLLLAQPTEKQMRGGEKKDILLIPEFCIMTGLTKDMAADFNFKRALGELTRLDPLGRAQALTQFIRRLNSNDRVNEEMRAWGLRFSESLVELNARSLPAEKIIISGESGESVPYQQRTGSFEREMRSKRMRTPARVEQWAILGLRNHKGLIDEFVETLKKICGPLGVSLGQPKLMPVDNERASGYMEICRKIPAGAKMVVIFVPNTNAERYSAVKRHFCVDAPCPSQVITTRVLSNKKNLMSVATKILIQMSTKMGAEPWGIAIPPRQCMIVGYDTYHDSQRKGYSVGGFVCTSSGTATSWFSRTSYHQSREELCGNFANNFRAGLKNWSDKNNAWPERIVIYRDGVSEGQIPYVYNVEMKQLQDVLKEKEGLDKVGFVFIIVTKRVNARFFLRVGERELQNPPPGTSIDSVVTRKQRYDFYLISQSVRQGTVNPTMYNIIADNTNWRPIHHQQLAYKLCHMYYNWAGTITVPAPCQYAHKLAFLTGTALHREHDTRLSHTLFFL